MRGSSARQWALWACVLAACGDPTPPPDAGADASAVCRSAADCDDELFCNGQERCEPDDPEASARGCIPAAANACPATETCVEASDRCDPSTCPDSDGDGEESSSCGGLDCDDTDAARHPGAAEICDPDDVDEDCNAATFGERDGDGDTYFDLECCNGDVCGNDCDDADPATHPTEAEQCDTVDNDCDGAIDEGATLRTWYRDGDGDMYGSTTPTMSACLDPGVEWVENDDDCNDANPGVHPSAPENPANAIDDDCDGQINETYELRGGIEPIGGRISSTNYRISRPTIEGSARSCSESWCVTGGIVSGDLHPTR